MAQAIIAAGFNGVQFEEIALNNDLWLRVPQLEVALGYSKRGAVQMLFDRHADEFSDSMTALVSLPTPGGPQETRIFSLRGCHLLAMFARTSVAKAFRVWVLDVLETLNRAALQAPALPSSPSLPITPDQRDHLRDILEAKTDHLAGGEKDEAKRTAWRRFHRRFGLKRYDQLPRDAFTGAVEFVLALDFTPQTALPPLALPPALAEEPDATRWHRNIREDLNMALRITEKLCCDSMVYLPQNGPWSQLEMMGRVNASVSRVLKNLYEAKSHLRDANAMTRMMARSAG